MLGSRVAAVQALHGVNALAQAAQEQQIDVMTILTDAGVVDTGLALTTAARWGGVASVKFLLHQQRERLTAGDATDT